MIRAKLYRSAIKPVFSLKLSVTTPSGHCFACGTTNKWIHTKIINDELADSWQLKSEERKGFDARESMFCPDCECSFRLRQLAECVSNLYGGDSLKDLVAHNNFSSLQIAEINSCGKLHELLKGLPHLKYSEYGSKDKKIRSESLESLSYEDSFFDLVLTSDTLEHVPDVHIALKEIHRVLKPGAKHVFTVPVIWNRKTKSRTNEQPSYHGAGEPDYLVFSEFGHDIINNIKNCGFSVNIYKPNVYNLHDVAGVIVATKVKEA